MQVAAQNALDVATHIASAHGVDAPDYTSAVDKLVELGVLSADFGHRFRQVAGFRNVLVHAYLDVDLAVLARALNDGLDDFERFAREVEGWLAR